MYKQHHTHIPFARVSALFLSSVLICVTLNCFWPAASLLSNHVADPIKRHLKSAAILWLPKHLPPVITFSHLVGLILTPFVASTHIRHAHQFLVLLWVPYSLLSPLYTLQHLLVGRSWCWSPATIYIVMHKTLKHIVSNLFWVFLKQKPYKLCHRYWSLYWTCT